MPLRGLLIYPDVKVGGSALGPAALSRLEEVEVETSVHVPGMVLLRFIDDATASILKGANITIGADIVVSSSGRTSATGKDLITAEVVSVEADFGAHGVHTLVRGYEKSHRLHLARHTKTFLNMTDSDIATQIAQDGGLTVGTVDSTSVTHEHVAQVDQTDWEFLVSRAREIGYEVGVSDGKFFFRKPVEASTAPTTDTPNTSAPPATELKWGANLLALDIRASGAGQAGTVTVRAWDPVNKQAITSDGTPASTEGSNQFSPSSMSSALGSATTLVVDRPVGVQAAADALASGLAAAVGSNFVECEGAATGDSSLNAGVAVRLSGVSDFFKGQYTLTRVRHTFGHDGYVTHFEISGRRDRSLAGMTSSSGTGTSSNATLGVVTGQVTQNGDSGHVGMVKIKFPWLDDKYESDWIRVAQLGAGPQSGAVWYPEKDDEVLVAFEFGDSRRPYVLSSLWNGQDQPLEGSGLFDSGKVKRRGFVSRKGHKLIFFDDGGKSGIGFLSSDGKLKLSLNETNGEIKIHAGGKVTIITEQGGDVKINSAGKLDVQTQGDTSIQATGQVKLNGSGGVDIESSGQVKISGSMIQIG